MDCKEFIRITKEYDGDICIFGAGDYGATWCYALLKDAGLKIACYIDNYKAGTICNGLPVYPLDHIKQHGELFVFVSTRGEAEVEMVEQLESIGVKKYYHFDSDYAPVDFAQYLDTLGDEELIKKFPSVMDDEEYLKIRFKYRMGYELDLEHPKTFNEKLNWLKIHDRNPIYTTMADKYAVKDYVGRKIGFEHVVPLYGVWERFEDIDFASMPNQFVLKCSHNCGNVIVCKNKDDFDMEAAGTALKNVLGNNAFWADREWPYKNIKPAIISEKFIESHDDVLEVYKFFCFDGEPYIIQVIQNDKTPEETIDYFNMEWNLLDIHQNYPNSKNHIVKPCNFEKMAEICRNLSFGIPFVRVDLYLDKEECIYFSEYTFFSDSGCERFYPEKWDYILGDRLNIKRLQMR